MDGKIAVGIRRVGRARDAQDRQLGIRAVVAVSNLLFGAPELRRAILSRNMAALAQGEQ